MELAPPTTADILKLAKFDSNKSALIAIEDSELFEQYFTKVEPQPIGTPKQIFRTGHAQGYLRKYNEIMPILREVLEGQERLVEALENFEDINNDGGPNSAMRALVEYRERMQRLLEGKR